MAEHEPTHIKTSSKPSMKTSAPRPKNPGETNYCRILGGRPKGPGLAEISISTKGHPDITVGMKGVLMGVPGTFEITAVRPGVATARLEGKGVEKQQYLGMAIVNPTEDLMASNRAATGLRPTRAEALEAKARLLSGK